MDAENRKLSEEFINDEIEDFEEGEILSETKTFLSEKVEPIADEFANFLSNLPKDSDVKLIVTRLADRNLSGQFRLKCENDEHTETMYYNNENDPGEIYEKITKKHGGGRYRIQIREAKGFTKHAWTVTLSDPPFWSEKEQLLKAEKEKQQPKVEVVQQPNFQPTPTTEPTLSRKELLKEILEEKKLEQELAALFAPTQSAEAPQTQVTKESIKMALIEKAMNEPELVSMAIRSVFDIPPEMADQNEEKSTVLEIFKYAATHPGETKTVIDTILGSFSGIVSPIAAALIPQAPPQPTAPIETISFAPKPRNETQPVSIPETQPQPTQTAQVDDFLPFIEAGETGE